MKLFPFFEDIEDRRFLIVGGGRIAKQKLSVLQRFTDRITVVAEEMDLTEKTALADDAAAGPGFRLLRKRFSPEDLAAGDLIVAATGDRELNREISRLAKEAGKPVNVVDDAEASTFIFPALIRQGGLVVGISTCGKSPAYAGYLRREIEKQIPDNIEEILDVLEGCRSWLPEVLAEQRARGEFLKELLQKLLSGEVRCGGAESGSGNADSEESLRKLAEEFRDRRQSL